MEAERRTTTLGDLGPDEVARLSQLTNDLRNLEVQLESSEEKCHQMQRDQKAKEQHLNDFLKKRLHELRSQLLRETQADHDEHKNEKAKAVEKATREHEEFRKKLEDCRAGLARVEKELGEKKSELEQVIAEDQAAQATIVQHAE